MKFEKPLHSLSGALEDKDERDADQEVQDGQLVDLLPHGCLPALHRHLSYIRAKSFLELLKAGLKISAFRVQQSMLCSLGAASNLAEGLAVFAINAQSRTNSCS